MLVVSSVYIFFIALILSVSSICQSGLDCRKLEWLNRTPTEMVVYVLFPLLPVFIFTLITYKMRDEVFQHWMKFAIWYVPLLIVGTFILYNAPSSGGVLSGAYTVVLIFPPYIIFLVVSIWRIVSEYRHWK